MSSVNVTLTLPDGKTNYTHPLSSNEDTLPALRQAIKSCQTQINQILTEVVEADRAKAKNGSMKGKEPQKCDENDDVDDDEDDDDDEEEDDGDKNGETSVTPAKKQKLDS